MKSEKRKIVLIGDTHGNHNVIKRYIKNSVDTTFFHVGDFGIGFSKLTYDEHCLNELNSLLKNNNCDMFVIRGNHDNPNFFNGNYILSNLQLVSDYSQIIVNDETFLLVGGAISIDREPRKIDMREYLKYNNHKELYWKNENFNLDISKIENLKGIDYVITHSSPHFMFPINDFNNHKDSHGSLIEHFVMRYGDVTLKDDLNKERLDISQLHDILIENGNKIKKWFMGHFHNHVEEKHGDVEFIILNIDEFYTLNNDIEDVEVN